MYINCVFSKVGTLFVLQLRNQRIEMDDRKMVLSGLFETTPMAYLEVGMQSETQEEYSAEQDSA